MAHPVVAATNSNASSNLDTAKVVEADEAQPFGTANAVAQAVETDGARPVRVLLGSSTSPPHIRRNDVSVGTRNGMTVR